MSKFLTPKNKLNESNYGKMRQIFHDCGIKFEETGNSFEGQQKLEIINDNLKIEFIFNWIGTYENIHIEYDRWLK